MEVSDFVTDEEGMAIIEEDILRYAAAIAIIQAVMRRSCLQRQQF
jgi:hypothetical protein